MIRKTKKHLQWVPSLVVAVFVTSSAVMKLVHAPQLAELYSKIGFENRMAVFAAAELVLISLFLCPRTTKIGLLLFTGYYGGAMAVEVSLGGVPFAPAIILIMIWIAAFFRNASLIMTEKRKLVSL